MGRDKDAPSKIFAFSLFSETPVANDSMLAENQYLMEVEEVESSTAQIGLTSVGKVRDGERIHPSAPPRTTFSHEYLDSAGRSDPNDIHIDMSERREKQSFSDYLVGMLDDLPYNFVALLHIVKDVSPVIGLILAVLGLFLEWHTGVCILTLLMTYEAAKKIVIEVFKEKRNEIRNKKADRLSDVMGRKIQFHSLERENLRIGKTDTECNLEMMKRFATVSRPDGINDPGLREIKICDSEIAKIMAAYPEEDAGPSEIKIETGLKRANIDISFCNELVKRKALIDTGAMSCIIGQDVIEELKSAGIKIPVAETKFTVEGVIQGTQQKHLDCVFLDIKLGGKLSLDNVPFIVMGSKDTIIGMNVMKACRLSTGFKGNGDMFVQIVKDDKLEELSVCFSHDNLEVISICDVTIHPQSYGVLELEIPKVRALPRNNIDKSTVLVQGNPEILDEQDLFIIPSIAKVRNGKLKVVFKNNTNHSFKIPGDMPIAKISEIEKSGLAPDKKDWINFGEYSKASIGINSIPRQTIDGCPCQLRPESHVITLCDSSGYSKYRSCALAVAEDEVFDDTLIEGKIPHGIVVGPPYYQTGSRNISVTRNSAGKYDYPLELIEELVKDMKNMSETQYFVLLCDWDPFKLEREKAELILKLKQACPYLSILNINESTRWCEECTPFQKVLSHMTGLYRVKKLHVHFLTGSYYPSREITDSDMDHPVLRYRLMQSLITIHIRDTTAIMIVHVPGYSYFGSFSYLRRLITIILKDLYFSGLGKEITLSGSNQDNRVRVEGLNLMVMKAFASAVGEINQREQIVWRYTAKTDAYIQEQAKKTEEVRIVEKDCGCGFCRILRAKRSPVVSKETILYSGSFKDFERIAREVEETYYGTRVNEQIITIIGGASVLQEADLDMANFEAEDHGELTIDPLDEKLVPYPVMLDVPTDEEKEISREWRDYIDLKEIPNEVRDNFEKMLDHHKSIFAYGPNEVRFVKDEGKTAELDLELVDDKPIWTKPFGLAGPILEKLELKIEELLKAGLIEPIRSDWNSPVFMVPHNSAAKNESVEDRKYRMIVDLRVVNSMVKFSSRYSYLVKGIEFAMEKLRDKKYFTVLDMNKAYRSLKVSRKTQEICSFIVPNSTRWPTQSFAFKSVIDGLNLGPGYYSYLINKALSYESRKATMIHIDDVCIASETLEQHLKDIDSVMRDLNQSGFMIAAAKACFFQLETRFLGHRISLNQITIDEKRKALFKDVPVPKTKKEMMRFLGMANYMGSFCDSFILRAGPLFDSLKGKKRDYVLTPEQLIAFEEVKVMIDQAPGLRLVDFKKPIILEVDASHVGAGSVLYQISKDSQDREIREVIRYGSKRFSVQQCLMYTSLEKESLAILFGIQQHSFFLGNSIDAIIRTDMKALICILSCYNNPTNHRMARVAHYLYSLPYSWQLTHIAGVDNIPADLLSRAIPDYRCAFSDRLRAFKDLDRQAIKLPKEWTRTPNVILTTADIMNNLKNNMLAEEVSDRVMEKRIKAFTKLGHDILDEEFIPSYDTSQKLKEIEQNRIFAEANKTAKIGAAAAKPYPVSLNYLVTTKFLSEQQNIDPFVNDLKLRLRAYGNAGFGKKLCKKFRLLNDTVLVTRADKNLPFEEAGNLRIVCTERMALIILSYMHIFNSHAGFNAIVKMFNASYKVKGVIAFAKIVTSCCRSCKLETWNPNNVVPGGRIPLPKGPNDTWWVDHMVFGGELTLKGKKINAAFNILDGYSGLLMSHLVPNQQVNTTIDCFRKTFAIMGVPRVIVSDNHKALNLNEQMRTFLRSQGVKNIVTTSPYRSQANKCERIHRTLRRGIRLAGETFGRSPLELYHQIVLMVNSRPLTMSDHPVIRKMIEKSERYISPFDLHFGRPMSSNPIRDLLGTCGDSKDRQNFQEKWKRLIGQLDEVKNEEVMEANENFKRPAGYEIGDLVYLENNARHKESLRFIRNLFVIVENKFKKFKLRPLFGNSDGGIIQAHGNDLKAYNYSHLLNILPPELKALMGQNMSPEELKEKVRNDPKFIPDDLLPKNVIEKMHLRNRLSPRSVTSVPAILSSDTSYISDVFRFQGDNGSDDDDEELVAIGGKPPSIASMPVSLPSRQSADRIVPEQVEKEKEKAPTERRPIPSFQDPDVSPIDGPGRYSETMKSVGGSPILRDPTHEMEFSEPAPRSQGLRGPNFPSLGNPRGNMPRDTMSDPGRPKAGKRDRVDTGSEPGSPSIPKWARKVLEKAGSLTKAKWWRPRQQRDDPEPTTNPEEVIEPQRAEPPEVNVADPPDVILYQVPRRKEKKKKNVRFDLNPNLREQVTRAGRKTKVPARFQDE